MWWRERINDGLDRRRFLAVRGAAAALQSIKHKYEYDHRRGVMSLDRRMY